MRSLLIATLCLACTSCSALLIRDDDTRWDVAGKVTVRAFNCAMTVMVFCASEWAVMKEVEEEERLFARFDPWQGTSLPESMERVVQETVEEHPGVPQQEVEEAGPSSGQSSE